ncbi:MAG: aldehyde dehydrogenase family protein [Phycisphaeraceae bacterium]|nr:aldehyde dehydrogenase family protein [Phycisphaeraceae bacterium]
MLRGVLEELGVAGHERISAIEPREVASDDRRHTTISPTTARPLATVQLDDRASLDREVAAAVEAFRAWREVPAPVRGQAVRAVGDALRRHKEALGALISLEVGKIRPEGLGEVQETIDIADFAVGLSRQLYGMTMPSERPRHRIIEQWHPLGPVGVITAFNFPNAVWGWNAMLAAVCGDSVVWKPSLMAPLTALATNEICRRTLTDLGHPDIFRLVIGADAVVGDSLVGDSRLPLISATGSCQMGRLVGQRVAARLGRCLLELGGNNAIIVEPDADLDLAIPAIVFGAIGTAGQRCTTTRRLLVHESIADSVVERLARAYASASIGDPMAQGTLVGPLINQRSVDAFLAAIAAAQSQGGTIIVGGKRAPGDGFFVQPTIVAAPRSNELPIAGEETFAPILYVFTYRDLDAAIALNNGVAQGLSSALFSGSVGASERFLGPAGSDCGLAYVNLGTSGAEIGGAFGGEKDTGGGRESGSDAWKHYMRRQTSTISHAAQIMHAQGIRFG